ncbi:hypothetical protein F5883DRAFT_252287 [Diaporthe sp. PMI_573]|nr:hypothetical protein F5883DRAFT_252287 [Diaporthaceae sp. PMI_573]
MGLLLINIFSAGLGLGMIRKVKSRNLRRCIWAGQSGARGFYSHRQRRGRRRQQGPARRGCVRGHEPDASNAWPHVPRLVTL